MRKNNVAANRRGYKVLNVDMAKQIALTWLQTAQLENVVAFGLPEIDDRYHIWRVPLLDTVKVERIGEIVIDAYTSLVVEDKSTKFAILKTRLLIQIETKVEVVKVQASQKYVLSTLPNTIILGDSEDVLQNLPAQSVNLVFTSPPYYNARSQYTDYENYERYLLKLRKIIRNIHHVLSEGRFFVLNVSPVLIRRTNRSQSSKRLAVPFDIHHIFIEEGYEFIDDIIWQKPEGAGWATGRGRRFAADRHPLQYKPVPVTEYILVYRKSTSKLIDWNIHAHPSQELVQASRIEDGYERTNVWRISPSHDKRHPAIFPVELAERVITYYSFKDDVVLDPFAGLGTVGEAATKLGRRFVLIEQDAKYISVIRQRAVQWLGKEQSTYRL